MLVWRDLVILLDPTGHLIHSRLRCVNHVPVFKKNMIWLIRIYVGKTYNLHFALRKLKKGFFKILFELFGFAVIKACSGFHATQCVFLDIIIDNRCEIDYNYCLICDIFMLFFFFLWDLRPCKWVAVTLIFKAVYVFVVVCMLSISVLKYFLDLCWVYWEKVEISKTGPYGNEGTTTLL